MKAQIKVLGQRHKSISQAAAIAGLIHKLEGRRDDAENLFVQVMETSKTKPREEHPDTLTSMANLASTYRN